MKTFVVLFLALFLSAVSATAIILHKHKPEPSELAQTARWLLHETIWGILSTLSTQEDIINIPFGNPQSHSDGLYHVSTLLMCALCVFMQIYHGG